MARSKLLNPAIDAIQDSGSILLSLVKGEQLEYPVTIAFATNALSGYVYEAVLIEGENTVIPPTAPKIGGVQTVLNVRIPIYRGTWDGAQAYNMEEVIAYSGKYYRLVSGVARVNTTTPLLDISWIETTPNKVYLQLPSTLGSTWTQQPTTTSNTYGFFELRVTESGNVPFQRTWKPIRGLVEILFSPTEVVPG